MLEVQQAGVVLLGVACRRRPAEAADRASMNEPAAVNRDVLTRLGTSRIHCAGSHVVFSSAFFGQAL